MKPFKHQIAAADKCWDIIKERGYVYLAALPRTGKTLTSLLIAEKSTKIKNVIILTKKAAISGWTKFLEDTELGLKHNYKVTNYEQVGSIKGKKFSMKLNPSDYDLAIIDESHNLGGVGKPTNRYLVIRKLCQNIPHIHLSGTAIVESPNSIYYQMHISKYSPFRYKSFYDFFRVYGRPYTLRFGGRDVAQYDRYKPELLEEINKFTVYMSQEDAGIAKDKQPVDQIHYVELASDTKKLYNTLQEDNITLVIRGMLGIKSIIGEPKEARNLVCDTTMKLRTSLHMLEGGVAKIDDEYIELGNTEKIDYIKETFGDTEDVGIMSHFIGERKLLAKHFKHAKLYSSSAHAEGVDLSHLKHFVIMSSDYSGSKFIQRRDRITNLNGSNTTIVNHILVKNAISDQVFKRVIKKQDFNNSTYEHKAI